MSSSRDAAPPAVEIAGLSHRFGDDLAVDALDLTVQRGECFGLLGPNGAGKTTTLRVLNTLYRPQTGTVRLFGLDVRWQAMAVRRLLGYVPQQVSIEGALTGRENVAWFARLFDVPRRERADRVAEVLATVDLTDAADRIAATYSGGMVRRLELAQALLHRPALLLSHANPLTYQVAALRGLLIGQPTTYWLDFLVLAGGRGRRHLRGRRAAAPARPLTPIPSQTAWRCSPVCG